jgi:hypothetical protein
MQKRYAMVLLALLGLTGALAQGQTVSSNWLLEMIMVGVPQTQIVRDPLVRGMYYMCWTDGRNRYGYKFSRRNFDSKLTQLQPGSRASLGTMLAMSPDSWTPQDEATCWSK